MKIRTITELEDTLTNEIGWRRTELEFFAHQIQNNNNEVNTRFLRASTALLYAHWEGSIKNSGIAYFRFLNSQKLKYLQLNAGLLSSSLKSEFDRLSVSGDVRSQIDFAKFLQAGESRKNATFSESLIDTGANLNWERFEKILVRLGFDEKPYSINRRIIDRVLAWRNAIAHGENYFPSNITDLTIETYTQSENAIVSMMNQFQNDISNSVVTRSYLES